MCIITILPPDVELTLEQVKDAMTKNADGVGIMFSLDGALYTGRTMMRDAYRVHRWLNANPSHVERVVHFRKTTAGATSRANLHPFEIHSRFGLMHNGTLPYSLAPCGLKDKRSDTAMFVEDLLTEIPEEMLTAGAVWRLIDAAVEENRIVMLDGETGELRWTADDMWTEGDRGIILSNTYSIESGALWGVKKTTFNAFHGYVEWSRPTSTYTPTTSTPTELKPASAPLVGSDMEVLQSAYISYTNGKRVVYATRASSHPWYSYALRLMQDFKINPLNVSASTLVLAFLHAKLTSDEVKACTLTRAQALIGDLMEFIGKEKLTPLLALIANYKESTCQSNTTPSTSQN